MQYPPDFTYPAQKVDTAAYAATRIAGLAASTRAVVQAGGCIGLWPLALSTHFDQVYTFEPAPSNLRYLQANLADRPTITWFPYALGAAPASVGLTRPKAQAGLWRVAGDGPIPMVALDAVLGEVPLDALVLDVEGLEVPVWEGAAHLIARHRPLLWFEYLAHRPAIDAFLAAQGYAPAQPGVGGDAYSIHRSRTDVTRRTHGQE